MENRYSNCCYALPLDELDSYYDYEDERYYYIGRCSRCKDGAEFFTENEFEHEREDK